MEKGSPTHIVEGLDIFGGDPILNETYSWVGNYERRPVTTLFDLPFPSGPIPS